MKKVLFVCTGNTCRSPMAEAIFNKLSKGTDFSASSCGIYADGVSKISVNAKTVLSESGISFDHTSAPVTKELIEDAHYIIGMSANHAMSLISAFPDYKEKIFAMPKDIIDPYGGNLDVYRTCRDEIEESVNAIFKAIAGDENA